MHDYSHRFPIAATGCIRYADGHSGEPMQLFRPTTMTRHWLIVMISIGISACAASGPDSSRPDAKAENASESTTENTTPAPATEDVIVVVDIPGESATPAEASELDVPAQSNLVCVRERRTGSHRARKVCRSRAQIAKEEQEAKDTFEDLHRSQVEYDVGAGASN